jgi:hypothetical protein
MYEYASKGLRMFFYSDILKYICAFLIFFRSLTILAAIAILVFAIIQLVGLYIAGNDIDDYKLSFYLSFAYFGIMMVARYIISTSILALFFTIIGYIISFYMSYNICVATKQARIHMGEPEDDLNSQTSILIKLLAAEFIGTILSLILSEIGFNSVTLSFINLGLILVAKILFLRFIYQSFQTFGSHYINADENN